MKPYLAILYDSLLESVRSRVLWILMIAWTILLAALFPLSVSQGESYRLANNDIRSAKTILDQLASASAGKGTRKQKAIYAKLDSEFQTVIKQRKANGRRISVGLLIDSLNKLLKVKDLYDKDAWPTAGKRDELKDLVDKKDLTETELEMLNRGLIDLAFEGSISSSAGQACWFTYAGIKIGNPIPISYSRIKPFIETGFFPIIMRVGLGNIALFVALIITSSMIPDMFQPGSLHLLLSKPITRSWLFLTKFVGGCIFVAFNICYLLAGLYLFAGTRLDIWNTGILWCIPLFVFMFVIIYSVSALVGLIWKNPIICVVVTAVFWGLCFGVGVLHFSFDFTLNLSNQFQGIYAVGDTPIVSTQQGQLRFWDSEKNDWKLAFGDRGGQKVIGPVYVPSKGALYFARTRQTPFGMNIGDTVNVEIAHAPDLIDANDNTYKSKIWEDGRLDSGPELPNEPRQLLPWKDTFVIATPDGIYRFSPEAAAQAEQQKSIFGDFGFSFSKAVSPAFPALTAKDLELKKPMEVAISKSYQHVMVYSHGSLTHLVDQENLLKEKQNTKLDIPEETVATIGCNDQFVIVCPVGFAPMVLDIETLSVVRKLESLKNESIKKVSADSKGTFYLLDKEGRLWTLPKDSDQCVRADVVGQGNILAIYLDEKDRLWISHSTKQVDVIDLATKKSVNAFHPKLGIADLVFRYVIDPFYRINPKPDAVNETIEYVLKNPKNKTLAFDRGELETPKVVADPWTPIWSNLVFVFAMLSLSCWYLYRQDL